MRTVYEVANMMHSRARLIPAFVDEYFADKKLSRRSVHKYLELRDRVRFRWCWAIKNVPAEIISVTDFSLFVSNHIPGASESTARCVLREVRRREGYRS